MRRSRKCSAATGNLDLLHRPRRLRAKHFHSVNEEPIGSTVLDAAFKVHTLLGAGLLESVYEAALAFELRRRGLRVEVQKAIAVIYEGQQLEVGFRADLVVEGIVLVELKSVEAVTPLFKKIATNYLKLIPLRLGFLINFNVEHLRDGITRIVNGLDGKPFFAQKKTVSRKGREEGEGKAGQADAATPMPFSPSSPSPPSRETFPPNKTVSREGREEGEGKAGQADAVTPMPFSPSSPSRETFPSEKSASHKPFSL